MLPLDVILRQKSPHSKAKSKSLIPAGCFQDKRNNNPINQHQAKFLRLFSLSLLQLIPGPQRRKTDHQQRQQTINLTDRLGHIFAFVLARGSHAECALFEEGEKFSEFCFPSVSYFSLKMNSEDDLCGEKRVSKGGGDVKHHGRGHASSWKIAIGKIAVNL